MRPNDDRLRVSCCDVGLSRTSPSAGKHTHEAPATTSRRRAHAQCGVRSLTWFIVGGALAALGGCRSSGAVSTIPTAPPTTTSRTAVASTVSAVATTTPPSTTPTTVASTTISSTTIAPTTTLAVEDQLKARIAGDYVRQHFRRGELVSAPTLDGLETNAAGVTVAGSDAYNRFVAYVKELVAVGDRIVPNEPDVNTLNVETVQVVSETEATVTYCQADNRKRVTPAESSPIGQEILVNGTGVLRAFRGTEPVRLTDKGWLPYADRDFGQTFEGQATCPVP